MDHKLIVVLAVFALVLTSLGEVLFQDNVGQNTQVKKIIQIYG